ncbi:preprotein translocase subunit YajC [Modestobacter versicolor]|uniref:preprotein translocase subunit YajC n=1 Tax=Modestobacter versicolor TaxID=429133 RepID=UPI0034DE0005
MESLPLLILVALAFVVLFVLPSRQRKKIQANAQAMQDSLTIGTPVMLTSGIHGTVAALGESTVDLEIAPGVVMTVARPAIMEIRKPATDTATPGSGSSATGIVDGDGDPTDPTR